MWSQRRGNSNRSRLVRQGLWLNYASIGYNSLEAVASLIAGIVAGSVSLIGFGADSLIEVSASGVAQWRLRSDSDDARREAVEGSAHRLIGWSFLALAVYIVVDSARSLWQHDAPGRSWFGMVVLALSLVVMPWLARAKRNVAWKMASGALGAEATQTSLCAYLSGIALGGVALNWLLGWWWADPVAALLMVPIIAREGTEGIRSGKPQAFPESG
jgi:divalent metal cation (Fe/Co/Zn/Cd) transporter